MSDSPLDDGAGAPLRRPADRRLRRLWRWLGATAAATVAATVVAVGGLGVWLWSHTPDAAQVASTTAVAPSRIVSADGVLLDTIGERVLRPVSLEEISPHVVNALLATEDRRFYEHRGVDIRRLGGAAWASLRGDVQGASTITQQLARNLFPRHVGNERSLLRKLRELVVALKIEQAYGKREILTMYLNRVPFLYNVTGIEMAAQTYFAKPAADLDAHEAALLVAMLKGPNRYDPQRWPDRARQRRDLVLTLMARAGDAEAARVHRTASQLPLGLNMQRHDLEPQTAPHFVQQVRRQLGDWADAHGFDLARDGLTIHTTLDSSLQALAEQAVARQSEFLQTMMAREWSLPAARAANRSAKAAAPADDGFARLWREQPDLLLELIRQTPGYKAAAEAGKPAAEAVRAGIADGDALRALQAAKTRLEAGFIAIDPRDGTVKAYVGSRDFQLDRYDHVAQAQRQPGSTFKPFVYGAALQAGIPPEREFVDLPPQVMLPDGRIWSPTDGSGSSGEMLTMRAGLARSKNTITAQVMQQIGPAHVVQYARTMGVARAALDPVPSLALGTSPVTLLEMAGAYGTLASLGVRREPVFVSHVVDRHGVEVARFSSQPQRAIPEDQATLLVDMLRDAVDKGTGRMLRTRFAIKADLAGKTGTTQHNTDGWFIAMRPQLVAGAWVGFNDQRVTMRSNQWGQGGHSALLLVGDFLQAAGQRKLIDLDQRFPKPPEPPTVELPPLEVEPVPGGLGAEAASHPGAFPSQPGQLVVSAPVVAPPIAIAPRNPDPPAGVVETPPARVPYIGSDRYPMRVADADYGERRGASGGASPGWVPVEGR